jgi:hypothetical protein
MISIRDLLRVELQERGQEIRHLQEYLYQVPPGVGTSTPSAGSDR